MNSSGNSAAGLPGGVYRAVKTGIEALVFIGIVILTSVLLSPLRNSVQQRMTALRDALIRSGEDYLGCSILYESMGPSIFGILDLRSVQIQGQGEPVLSVARLRLSYSLWDLLRGRPLDSLRSISLDAPSLVIDRAVDPGFWEKIMPGDSSPEDEGEAQVRGQGFFLDVMESLPQNVRIRVRRGRVSYRAEHNLALEDLSFDGRVRDRRVILDGRWNGGGVVDLPGVSPFTVGMTGIITGELAVDLRSGNLNLRVPSLRGDRFSARALTVNLAVTESGFELRKIQDRLPFDLYAAYDRASGALEGEFRAENFSPDQILSFSGDWAQYRNLLALRTSGSASIKTGGEGLAYAVKLSGTVPGQAAGGRTSFVIDGDGDGKGVRVRALEFTLPQGSFAFSGAVAFRPLALDGRMSVAGLSLSGQSGISGDLSFSTYDGDINLFGESVSLGPVLLSALDARISPSADSLLFEASALRFRDMESYEDVRLSRIDLDGSYDFNPRQLQASLSVDSFSLGDMAELAKPFTGLPETPGFLDGALNDISLTTEIFLTTDFEHFSYNVPRFVSAYEGRDILAFLAISGTDRRLEFSDGMVIWSGGRVETSGFADFSNIQDISFSFQASYNDRVHQISDNDLTYYFEGLFLDQRSLSIQGSYDFSLNLSLTGSGSCSGYVEAGGIPIPSGTRNARFYLMSFFRWDSRESWSVELDRFELLDLYTPGSSGSRIWIQGVADQRGANFPQLYFDDGRGALQGRIAANWTSDFSSIRGNASLLSSDGNERYQGEMQYDGGALDLRFYGSRVQISRFIVNSYNILATGEIRINRVREGAFQANMVLSSLSAQVGNNALALSARASLDQDEFAVENVQLLWGGLQAQLPELVLNRLDSVMRSRLEVSGLAFGRTVEFSARAGGSFEPVSSWLEAGRMLRSCSAVLTVEKARLDAIESKEPFSFDFSREASSTSLYGGPGNMVRLQISDSGDFYAALSNPSPIQGALIGSFKDEGKTIDAHTSNLYVDLSSLWRFIPRRDIVDFPGGFINADLRIDGPVEDPGFYGSARANSVRIRLPGYLPEDIGPVVLNLEFNANEMHFDPVSAPVGPGRGMVSGSCLFEHWLPGIFNIDIDVPRETPIPYGFNIAGFITRGLASGLLRLGLDGQVFFLDGKLTAQDTMITMEREENQGDAPEGPESPDGDDGISFVSNFTVVSGRKVEFVWPSEDFPVIQAYADMGDTIVISSDSSTNRFSVTGDVSLRSGEVFYFQRSFYIREGILSLNENEDKFDPLLSARAEIRDRNDEGPVTIAMIIDHAPLSSFTPRFESNPPLSQMEIVSLLGQNLTGTTGNENTGRMLALSTTDLFVQSRVIRRFERGVRNFLNLDMFSIRTRVLQNAVMRITGLDDPVDGGSEFGNYFDGTTISFGKYIGADMFFQTMLSVRYDPVKANSSTGGLKIEPDISIEWRGPLFNIQWNLVPQHPENLFIDDLSFTLNWKWSF
ncbi:MAG: translocation/assembly module TamB [Spirochaetaceae bacterium]|nr:translocation/assembly module TamB [Spirochaetaceae bacterium]